MRAHWSRHFLAWQSVNHDGQRAGWGGGPNARAGAGVRRAAADFVASFARSVQYGQAAKVRPFGAP
eukprot:4106434-Alexandrium_andersonii.AAC.1